MNAREARTIALMLESDGPGGAEHVMLQLATELRERGHSVCPVGPKDGSGWLAGQFRDLGFETEVFINTSMLDWKCVRGLVEVLRRRRVDVVHSHEFSMAVYGAAAGMIARKPQVVTMHGGKYYETRSRRRRALRWALRRSAAGVAVSHATREHLEQALGLRIGSVHVVYNGIRFTAGNRRALREELGLGDAELMIVAVGNLYPVKGHSVLLEALGVVSRRRPELAWRLAIAGRGGEEEKLRALAIEHDLAERVHLLGFRQDVPNILAAADVYAMPSLSEGMPLALLEAMFSRTPIVASDVGGIPEVVTDEECALLVEPSNAGQLADALERLLAEPDTRTSLAESAAKRAERRHSVDAMVDGYEELYFGR